MANLQSTNIFGTLKVHAQTSSNDKDNGAMVILGGVGIGGNLNVGGDIKATDKEITISKINGLSITQATEKTLDLSNASLTIGDSKGTGKITIKSNDTGDKTLTLEASHTIKSLTKDYVLIVGKDDNVIESEAQLDISRGGTGIKTTFSKYALLGDLTKDDRAPSWRAITSADISDATSTNNINMIVKRDNNGNFSAGTITATLSGNASTASKLKNSKTLWGVSFDGSSNISGTLKPTSSDEDVGTSDNKFRNAYLSGDLDVSGISSLGDVSISGDLTVEGDMVVRNTETVKVSDKNIELGAIEEPNNNSAEGGGITLLGGIEDGDKTIIWGNDSWTSSENWNLEEDKVYKIDGTLVLSDNTLGDGIVNSSLTKVGTIKSGIWQGTKIAVNKGGTNLTSYAKGDLLHASKANTLSSLEIGTQGQVLKVSSDGLPEWSNEYSFTHPNSVNTMEALTGANVIDKLTFTDGHVSSISTRPLTPTNIGLGNVENTALSTWEGSSNIAVIGNAITGNLAPSSSDKEIGTSSVKYKKAFLGEELHIGEFSIEASGGELAFYRNS